MLLPPPDGHVKNPCTLMVNPMHFWLMGAQRAHAVPPRTAFWTRLPLAVHISSPDGIRISHFKEGSSDTPQVELEGYLLTGAARQWHAHICSQKLADFVHQTLPRL
eukprot:1159557-Pelagomonas_calceolata.AAC.2